MTEKDSRLAYSQKKSCVFSKNLAYPQKNLNNLHSISQQTSLKLVVFIPIQTELYRLFRIASQNPGHWLRETFLTKQIVCKYEKSSSKLKMKPSQNSICS